MQGDLDCKLDPKLCAIVSGKWILHVYLTVQYEEDDAEGKRERGLRRKDRKCIKETHRVMVEMGITCVAEEGWCIRKSSSVWRGLACLVGLAGLAGLTARNLYPPIFLRIYI